MAQHPPLADELAAVARAAAAAGAQVAMAWRRRASSLRIEQKTGPRDLVSRADRDAEEAIRAVLAELRPTDGVLGEEGGTTAGTSAVQWAVDPIDGTTNYLYGRSDWAVSVAAVRSADRTVLAGAVAEPMLDRMTVAAAGGGTFSGEHRTAAETRRPVSESLVEVNFGRDDQRGLAGAMVAALVPRVRDVRRGGSAACALAQLATGRVDAVWAPGLQPWDCAAGVLLVSEAGGTVGDLSGPTPGTWPAGGDVLAAGPQLWASLRQVLQPIYQV
ncbi:inositol monophosphatase [Mycobacterium sp. MYCO198283]|uniref:inositol monophosphatase family protein n=1 Tax=Mycobacterium sp. MYCO198283 TaxID=2883505 RepID=UPI001E46E094|nr:inositol monophosphatase family protein [Mycobacterium sp. MYCO198283]MCG5431106.1 inositol monophosphatase [Mycobacterium sp. MYCO198283]